MNDLQWRFSARRAAVLFLVGATIGVGGDVCHILSGTDGYPDGPWMMFGFPFPMWVPLLFGTSLLAIGESHLIHDRLMDRPGASLRPGAASPTALTLNSILCMATYAASGFVPWATGGGKDVVIALGAVLTWTLFDRTRSGILAAIGTAAVGFVVENVLSANGAFWYLPHAANFMRVPSWLPWLYITVAITGGNLARFLERREARV